MVIMVPNDEVMRKKEKLREVINLISDFLKTLKNYTDPETYTPEQRKPVIDKIHELEKYIQKKIDELKELDK